MLLRSTLECLLSRGSGLVYTFSSPGVALRTLGRKQARYNESRCSRAMVHKIQAQDARSTSCNCWTLAPSLNPCFLGQTRASACRHVAQPCVHRPQAHSRHEWSRALARVWARVVKSCCLFLLGIENKGTVRSVMRFSILNTLLGSRF